MISCGDAAVISADGIQSAFRGSIQAPIYIRTMSATAPTSTTNAAAAPTDASKDKEGNTQTQLGALEEDDEFEEFPAQGLYIE